MKVKELKEKLQTISDEVEVMVSGEEHGYWKARCYLITALKEGSGRWIEDYGEELTPEAEFGQRVPVLLFGL